MRTVFGESHFLVSIIIPAAAMEAGVATSTALPAGPGCMSSRGLHVLSVELAAGVVDAATPLLPPDPLKDGNACSNLNFLPAEGPDKGDEALIWLGPLTGGTAAPPPLAPVHQYEGSIMHIVLVDSVRGGGWVPCGVHRLVLHYYMRKDCTFLLPRAHEGHVDVGDAAIL